MAESQDPEPILYCPHCQEPIIIEKINCGIFRHAILKSTGKQINPHAPKDNCDELFHSGKIWGCGKPFQVIKTPDQSLQIKICDYI
jgi:hypothetical protein